MENLVSRSYLRQSMELQNAGKVTPLLCDDVDDFRFLPQ